MTAAGMGAQDFEWGPTLDESACREGCRTCRDFCQNGVYEVVDGRVRVARRGACVPGCSHCATLCEAGALTFPSLDDLRAARRDA